MRTLEWIDRAEVLVDLRPVRDAASRISSKRSGTSRSTKAAPSRGTRPRRSRNCCAATASTTAINKAIGKLIRVDLILIDDVGLLPISTDAADALFRVVDAAYEKRSIAISSNIHPSGFDELMPKTLATATVDRLLHHAHVLITDGQDSYRLAQATAGKGVNHSPEPRPNPRWGETMATSGEK